MNTHTVCQQCGGAIAPRRADYAGNPNVCDACAAYNAEVPEAEGLNSPPASVTPAAPSAARPQVEIQQARKYCLVLTVKFIPAIPAKQSETPGKLAPAATILDGRYGEMFSIQA